MAVKCTWSGYFRASIDARIPLIVCPNALTPPKTECMVLIKPNHTFSSRPFALRSSRLRPSPLAKIGIARSNITAKKNNDCLQSISVNNSPHPRPHRTAYMIAEFH